MLTDTQSKILHLLKEHPKTWHQLHARFSDKTAMNLALLHLSQSGMIVFDKAEGVYRVV
jgi:predicted transcriptional regulator